MVKRGKLSKMAARGRVGIPSLRKGRRKQNQDALDIQEREIAKAQHEAGVAHREQELARQPHTLVIHRGKVSKYVKGLELDLRQVMQPNTAGHLKVMKTNNIKDFVVNGAVLGVTNMMVLTTSNTSLQLRMMRFAQGSTITFKVKQYSIARHIVSSQKRPAVHESLYKRAPLVIMNGFKDGMKHMQLVQTFIQNMFPTLNIDEIDLRSVKRCLMVNYNEEEDTIDFRHYAIRIVATGLSKSVKKIIDAEKSSAHIPDLSRYKDISEFMLNPGQLSDSEFEGEQMEVELSQTISEKKGTQVGDKSNIRLMELGPRMTLELVKIQEGIDEGEVLYHKFVEKSSSEIMELRKQLPLKKKTKKRHEQAEQRRVIRRLEHLKEQREREEAEIKEVIEKAARKQAAATGQNEEIENDRMKDREIAMNREREMKMNMGGREGQNKSAEPQRKRKPGKLQPGERLDYTRKKKKSRS